MINSLQTRALGRALLWCLGMSFFLLAMSPRAWSGEAAVLKEARAAEHPEFTRVVLVLEGLRPLEVDASRAQQVRVRFESLRVEAELPSGTVQELELLQGVHFPDPDDTAGLELSLSRQALVEHYVYGSEAESPEGGYHLVLDLYPGLEPAEKPKPVPEPSPQEEPSQEKDVVYQSLDQSQRVKVKHVVKSASRPEPEKGATEAKPTRLHRIRVGEHELFTRVVLDAEGPWPEAIDTSGRKRVEFSYLNLERLFPGSLLSRLEKGAVKALELREGDQPRLSIEFRDPGTRVETMFLKGASPKGNHYRLVIDLYPPQDDSDKEIQSRSTLERTIRSSPSSPTGRTVRVAVVRDGPSDKLFTLESRVERELAALLPRDTRLVFLRRKSFDAGWDPDAVGEALAMALQEPEVDLVFANGVLCTEQAAGQQRALSRPVVGGLFAESLLPEDAGPKKNFHCLLIADMIRRDLLAFHQLVGFSSLHFCLHRALVQGLPGFLDQLARLGDGLGVKIIPLPAEEDPASVLRALGPEAEAVYLTPLLRMTDAARADLVQGLNERGIPTFSLFGHSEVRRGVLASRTPDLMSRLARRLALDMHQILDGAAPESLSRWMVVEGQLLINGRTAGLIGFDPSLSTMVNAQVLHSEALGPEDTPAEILTLEKAMSMAGQQNVRMAIEEFRSREAQESTQQAQSGFLPQAEAGLQTYRIDRDRSRASLSLTPWKRTSGSIKVRQIIFDDSVLSGYLAARHLEKRQAMETRSIKLDVEARAGELFLQVLQALALERIAKDNLELTRENLRLARIRRRVGMSGPEDVYRWETQEATQKGDLFAADSRVEKARVALNQVLGCDQNAKWQTEDIRLQDQDLFFLDARFRRVLQRASQVRTLREYGVKVALDNAPELKAADRAVQAAEIELGRRKRRFYVPSLGASFDYTRELDREDPELNFETGPSSPAVPGMAVPDIGSEITDLVSDRDRDEWRVALELKLPLFQGGKRFHDVDRAQAALSRLRSQRTRAAQLIEQQVRSAVYDLQSSQPRIGLSRKAAEQARKNLDLVQDKYAKGAASILDLIDAQNQALAQDQAATIAVYRYLQDLIRFQRAMAWFEHRQSQEDKEAWIRGFTHFVPVCGRDTRSVVED